VSSAKNSYVNSNLLVFVVPIVFIVPRLKNGI